MKCIHLKPSHRYCKALLTSHLSNFYKREWKVLVGEPKKIFAPLPPPNQPHATAHFCSSKFNESLLERISFDLLVNVALWSIENTYLKLVIVHVVVYLLLFSYGYHLSII